MKLRFSEYALNSLRRSVSAQPVAGADMIGYQAAVVRGKCGRRELRAFVRHSLRHLTQGRRRPVTIVRKNLGLGKLPQWGVLGPGARHGGDRTRLRGSRRCFQMRSSALVDIPRASLFQRSSMAGSRSVQGFNAINKTLNDRNRVNAGWRVQQNCIFNDAMNMANSVNAERRGLT